MGRFDLVWFGLVWAVVLKGMSADVVEIGVWGGDTDRYSRDDDRSSLDQ